MNKQIIEFIDSYPDWSDQESVLQKRFELTDFEEVKQLVPKIMQLADEHNHHPEVTFSYNWVRVKTTTHDEGNAITEKDIQLASAIEKLTA